MFGVAPLPADRRPRRGPEVCSARASGAVFAATGLACLVILALMPLSFSLNATALLIGLPLAAGGLLGLICGYAGLLTRIEIAADGVGIEVPGWRAVPVPPVRRLRLSWDAVRAVRRRTEVYRLWPRLRLPLEVHAVETQDGRAVFGGFYLSELEPVMITVADRAGCGVHEDGEVEAGLLRTLRRGAPPWPPLESAATESAPARRLRRRYSQPTGS